MDAGSQTGSFSARDSSGSSETVFHFLPQTELLTSLHPCKKHEYSQAKKMHEINKYTDGSMTRELLYNAKERYSQTLKTQDQLGPSQVLQILRVLGFLQFLHIAEFSEILTIPMCI